MLDDFDDLFNNASHEDETNDETEQTETESPEVVDEVEEDNPEDEEADQESNEVEDEANEEEDEEPSLEIGNGKDKQKVPLGTFLDMIDKRKEDKARADRLEQELAEFKARYEKPAEDTERFDPLVDPDAYMDHVQAQIQQAVFNERMVQCYTRAAAQHEPEYLKQVEKWAFEKADVDPRFNAAANQAMDPVAYAIQQYESETKTQQIMSDPEAWARKFAEEKGWLTQSDVTTEVAPVASKPQAKKPIRSLTGAGSKSTAKVSKSDTDMDFNAIFDRK